MKHLAIAALICAGIYCVMAFATYTLFWPPVVSEGTRAIVAFFWASTVCIAALIYSDNF